MRINHTQIKRRIRRIRIRQRNKHRLINDRVTLIHEPGGLVRIPAVRPRGRQIRVRQVQLVDPSHVLGRAGRSRRHVAVVRPYRLARVLPLEEDLLPREGERLALVAADAGRAALTNPVRVEAALLGGDGACAGVADAAAGDLVVLRVVGGDTVDVSAVDDVEGGEVLPGQARGAGGALGDVLREVGPGPGLGDAGLEPDGLRVEAGHHAEAHLLARLGGDRLGEELADFAAVEVVDEAPDAGLAPAGEALVEVDEFADGREGVVVGALGRGSLAEHVGEEC